MGFVIAVAVQLLISFVIGAVLLWNFVFEDLENCTAQDMIQIENLVDDNMGWN